MIGHGRTRRTHASEEYGLFFSKKAKPTELCHKMIDTAMILDFLVLFALLAKQNQMSVVRAIMGTIDVTI